MAGVRRLKKFTFCAVIAIILIILIAIPVSGEQDKEVTEYSDYAEKDVTPSLINVTRDADGEVDIEDVEVDSQERRRAYYSYQTYSTENYVNISKSNDESAHFRDTALAVVYGQSVENGTDDGDQDSSSKAKIKSAKIKVSCLGAPQVTTESSDLFNSTVQDLTFWMNISRNITRSVEIVNTTTLLHDVLYINPSVKSRANPSNCSVILFYARWCPFSAKAAPHFNALPRAFPSVRVAAVDSSLHPTVNTYFGILSVPTVILFHNGKIIAKFNDSLFTLNRFADFIQAFSDLQSTEKINVTSQDFHGPLPSSPIKEVDYYLYIAWVFIVTCFIHYVSKSSIWKKIMDLVRTTWREAEAHHEHDD